MILRFKTFFFWHKVALASILFFFLFGGVALADSQVWYFHDAAGTMTGSQLISETAPHVTAPAAAGNAPGIFTEDVANKVFRYKPGETGTVNDYAIANEDGVNENASVHISTASGPQNGLGWWSDTAINGTYDSGTWAMRQHTVDARANLVSHFLFTVWRVPQNSSITGAVLIAEWEDTAVDTWQGGNVVATSTSASIGVTTLNNEYLFVELWEHNTAANSRLITSRIEGSNLAENDRFKLVTPVFKSLEQIQYRWFANANTLAPGAASAAQNATTTEVNRTDVIRLRVNVKANTTAFPASRTVKLQFATVSAGPWTDVGAIGSSVAWRGFDNTSVTDGVGASTAQLTSTTVLETYEEANPSAATPNAIPSGGFGEWDWVIENNSANVFTSYYFRMVENDGTVFSTYTVYAGVKTALPTVGTVMSPELDFDWVTGQTAWGEAIWSETETEGTVSMQVFYTVTTACDTIVPDGTLTGNSSGFATSPINISGLTPVASTYNKICLKATLNAGASLSPTLDDWTISWGAAAASTFDQAVYKWFNNTDGTNVGSALVLVNTTSTLSSSGAKFRLRLLMGVGTANLDVSGQTFKIQFASKGGGSCASPTGAYADVATTTLLAFFNNTAPTNGSAMTASTDDPTHGGTTIVNQSYIESNIFSNSQAAVNSGQDAKWDFSMQDNGAVSDTAYCFRIVKSDGTALDTYTVYPALITGAAAAGGGGGETPPTEGGSGGGTPTTGGGAGGGDGASPTLLDIFNELIKWW